MQGVILQAIILLVTNIDLSIMDNIGSTVEYLTWVAEEVIFRKIITITAFVFVCMCGWHSFHKCSVGPEVHTCAEQNMAGKSYNNFVCFQKSDDQTKYICG